MRANYYAVCTAIALAGNLRGAYEFEVQKGEDISLSVTSTNLMIKFNAVGWGILPDADAEYPEFELRGSREYKENDKPLILTPDKRTEFYTREGRAYRFAPIAFLNKQKGFRIAYTTGSLTLQNGEVVYSATTNIMYVALSDSPVQVGEEDVEMIMGEGREWTAHGKPRSVPSEEAAPQETPPNPDEPPPPPESEPPPDGAEDAQPEAQTEARTLWPYALIPPAFLAALWVVRRKRKTGGWK